jgi:hypothetical protein
MACVICLDEEVPTDTAPCKTCFSVKFHKTCLQEYKRSKDTCPTCKAPFEVEQVPDEPPGEQPLERISEHEHIVRRIREDTHAIFSEAYRTAMFFQLLLILVTIAFVPHKHKFSFASLLVTFLTLVWAHVFERVDSFVVTFRLLAAMSWSMTASNTIIFDQSAPMVAYVILSCVNVFVYMCRKRPSASVQPE